MANPATVADIESRFYRTLTTREQTIAQVWLDDAYAVLLGRRPNLEADVTANTVSTATVVRVLVAMVSRVLSNPEGLAQEAIDDYSYRRDSTVAAGALYVSPEELGDISPGRSSRRSIRLISYGET